VSALRSVLAAFSHFSILPVRSFDRTPAAAAIGWLPLVGLFTGALAGALGYCAFRYLHGPLWPVVLAFAGSIVLTGAIHVDGFLDCCDALAASVSVQRRLEILRDPHHGSFAVAGMAVLASAWLAGLAHVEPMRMPLVLAFSAVASRASAVLVAGQYPHARTGATYAACRIYGAAWLAAIGIVLAAARAFPLLFVAAGAALLAQILAFAASRRLGGGLTGDCFGAIVVVTEVASLAAAGLAWV
jgi:adenosylcobinamide-GDP ribazoletransferase